MANPVSDVLLTEKQLGPLPEIVDPGCGAVVDFHGVVRELEDGRSIEGIEYESHLIMADHQLRDIAQRAVQKFDLAAVVIYHRIGFVPVGEVSLLVRVGSGHRGEAYAGSQWIVEELKQKVPIWKRPRYRIGSPTARARDLVTATI